MQLHHELTTGDPADVLQRLETPYVVKLHRYSLLAPAARMFTFSHPNRQRVIDNSRYKAVVFERPPAAGPAVCHGFAGYFESVLYKDVLLSIYPPTATHNMFSWFPIYFPLREPLHLAAGQPLEAHMWRCVGGHKVWYEWCVAGPVPSHIHNPGGRSYYVGL